MLPRSTQVQSFGETCRRSVQLKRDKVGDANTRVRCWLTQHFPMFLYPFEQEIKDDMRYDLVVLMRYDIFFRLWKSLKLGK